MGPPRPERIPGAENPMADTTELLKRLDAELKGVDEKIKKYQAEKAQEFEGRQQRLDEFLRLCDRLREVWRPRFEAFAERFKDKVEVVRKVTEARRAAAIHFKSPLATFTLTFTATTDSDVRNFVLDYTLDVLPILMKFEKNKQLELPLDKVDPAVVGAWIDDRLVEAVKVYLEVHQNSYYLKGHLVRDPVAEIEFPRYAAAATLEWNGTTQYFVSEESRDAFKRQHNIT